MVALIASFFSLFVGPLIYQTFGPMQRTDKIVSGVVLIVVSGMLLLEVLPDVYQEIGSWTIALVLLGFLGPTLIEKTFRKAANTTHVLTLCLGLSGLIVHAMLDGLAVKMDEQTQQNSLTMAVIMHRLPVGLTIWWMLKPLLGEKYALAFLIFMGVSTFIGYASGQSIGQYQEHALFSILQAVIAGSLLHVIVHKPHSDGCMHASDEHEKNHHENDQKINQKSLLEKIFFRWENVGYLVGFGLMLIAQQQPHYH